jgi:hypothetical protein
MNCKYLALLDLSWVRTSQGNLMCVSVCDGIYQYCFRAGIWEEQEALGILRWWNHTVGRKSFCLCSLIVKFLL